jgi:hypothetical protein
MWWVGDLFLLDSGDPESDHTSDAREKKQTFFGRHPYLYLFSGIFCITIIPSLIKAFPDIYDMLVPYLILILGIPF